MKMASYWNVYQIIELLDKPREWSAHNTTITRKYLAQSFVVEL